MPDPHPTAAFYREQGYAIFRGIIPFLVADFLHLALLIAAPALTLFLPSILGGAS